MGGQTVNSEAGVLTVSGANQLIKQDVSRWLANTLRFFLPVFSIYLGGVSDSMLDGFAWSDMVPNIIVIGAMMLYVINSLQDLITKYVQVDKYIDGDKV